MILLLFLKCTIGQSLRSDNLTRIQLFKKDMLCQPALGVNQYLLCNNIISTIQNNLKLYCNIVVGSKLLEKKIYIIISNTRRTKQLHLIIKQTPPAKKLPMNSGANNVKKPFLLFLPNKLQFLIVLQLHINQPTYLDNSKKT